MKTLITKIEGLEGNAEEEGEELKVDFEEIKDFCKLKEVYSTIKDSIYLIFNLKMQRNIQL